MGGEQNRNDGQKNSHQQGELGVGQAELHCRELTGTQGARKKTPMGHRQIPNSMLSEDELWLECCGCGILDGDEGR